LGADLEQIAKEPLAPFSRANHCAALSSAPNPWASQNCKKPRTHTFIPTLYKTNALAVLLGLRHRSKGPPRAREFASCCHFSELLGHKNSHSDCPLQRTYITYYAHYLNNDRQGMQNPSFFFALTTTADHSASAPVALPSPPVFSKKARLQDGTRPSVL
jgi:hypothetical protein